MTTSIKIISFLFITSFGIQSIQNDNPKKKGGKTAKQESTVNVPEGLNLGNKAPEITLNSPEGKAIKLSSLKGKLVLIDFWASWCGPCRQENPSVVAAHHVFKDQKFKDGNGFAVYSVSLDKDLGAWQKAINVDGLNWPYHVSDLAGWNNAAAMKYAVNSIPTNYLINGNGIIIAKALRGDDLHKALENLRIK